jgi:biopolymer transport protein ExbB
MDLLHNIIYGLMFFCVFLAVLISVERFIFISNNLKRSRLVAKTIKETPNQHLNNLSNDFVSQVVKSVESLYSQATKLDVVQDRTDALYIDLRQELYKKLWMLDTIITAAPLLGL